VEALDVRPGQTVLDLCAAPGGKTSYIAELMRGQGTVYAMDLGAERLELLAQTVARLGLSNVRVLANEPGRWPRDLPAQFDRVLVDVPCSNTGVLNRRAEARWRFSAASLESLTRLQMELLSQGAQAARVGGLCVYSTCSLEPEENAGLVRRFLAANPWMVLQVERETLPSAAGDGGYFARLVRHEASAADAE
jgi:16S rRNA (cytosine967-C5)-methyltransferase